MKNTIIVIKSLYVILLLCTFSACDIASTDENSTATPRETSFLLPSLTPNFLPTVTPNPPPQKAYKTFSSPNGDWIASIYSPIDRNAPQFTTNIKKVDGKFEWVLNYRTSQFEEEAYYYPFYWANDKQFLYLSINRAMDGCGKVLEFYSGSGLFKLDLKTGELSEIIPEKPLVSFAFSISQSETMLAYAEEAKTLMSIQVKDILEVKEYSFTLNEKYQGVGNFTWFPSEEAILFVAKENICGDKPNYTLITLNLSTSKMKVIIDNLDKNLTAVKWESTEILRLSDWEGNQWILNLKSPKLTLATATP